MGASGKNKTIPGGSAVPHYRAFSRGPAGGGGLQRRTSEGSNCERKSLQRRDDGCLSLHGRGLLIDFSCGATFVSCTHINILHNARFNVLLSVTACLYACALVCMHARSKIVYPVPLHWHYFSTLQISSVYYSCFLMKQRIGPRCRLMWMQKSRGQMQG